MTAFSLYLLLLSPLVSAAVHNRRQAQLSPNGQCGVVTVNGAQKSYTCGSSCCSQYGWCGATADYCGTGCQSAYGTCSSSGSSSSAVVSSSTARSTSGTATASSTTSASAKPSPLNQCGSESGFSCQAGLCCSQYNWCGSTPDYCGNGCQSAFGLCDAKPPVPTTTATVSATTSAASSSGTGTGTGTRTSSTASAVPSPEGRCGADGNGVSCQPGLCCSQYGWCGATTDHCGANCQSPFGKCDVVTASSVSTGTTLATSVTSIPLPTATTVPGGQCGPDSKTSCPSTQCCSRFGTCGATSLFCGSGCLAGYGKCGTGETGGRCGPMFDNALCSDGQCCGSTGVCGFGANYCALPGCNSIYGECDDPNAPAGPSTVNSPRPKVGSVPYGVKVYKCTTPGTVAVTFDDGPSPFTSDLLTLLKVNGIRATFFVLGKTIDQNAAYPDLIKRMNADGHQVASHSFTHPDMSTITSAERRQQLRYTETVIARLIGKFPAYFRAPYLSCDTRCEADVNELGYHLIDLDFDTKDFENPTDMTPSKEKLTAAFNANPSTMLALQHDTVEKSATDLTPFFIDLIKQKGLKGVPVGECLGDAPANWYRSV